MGPVIGVLALQGGVEEHLSMLRALNVRTLPVRTLAELEEADALILPGGESPAHYRLLGRLGLLERLRQRICEGMPVWGTCAGAILLAGRITGQEPILHAGDYTIERNSYGGQLSSFRAAVSVKGIGDSFPAVFIRAPRIIETGVGVEVLSSWQGHPVACRQAHILVTTFHPELTTDGRFHRYFIESVVGADCKVEP